MKIKGIVALSVLAALAVVAVACGGADAEVKVDKGLAAYAGANPASIQSDAGEAARSASQVSQSAPAASEASYKESSASAPTVNTGGMGGPALARDVTSSSGAALAPLEQAGPLGIVVQGYGRATAPADTARIGFVVGKSGVVYPEPMPAEPGVIPEGTGTEGGTAQEVAPSKPDVLYPATPEPITEADLQPLLDAIKAQGVSDADIDVTIYPSTYYGPYGTPTARVTVTLHDVSKVGSLIDAGNQAVAESGTIYIQNVGVIFSVNDCDALLKEARKAAVEDARDNGAGLAEALGVGLGGIQGATEYNWDPYGYSGCQSQSGPVYDEYEGPSYDPSVPAEVQIVSNVTISFAMQ
jgi:uncharacterized protein YggE